MSARSRAFRRLVGKLGRPAPALVFRFMDLLAFVVRRGLSARQVREIFSALPPDRIRSVVRNSHRVKMRDIGLRALLEFKAALRPELVIIDPAVEQLQGPLIVGFFHDASRVAIRELSERIPGEVLALGRGGNISSQAGRATGYHVGPTVLNRAAAFRRSLRHLQGGGVVLLALDAWRTSGVVAPLLGKRIELARGPFALARMTGTRIVPVSSRWEGDKIAILIGEPIEPADSEAEMAAGVARYLERVLLESPEQLSVRTALKIRHAAGHRGYRL